MTHDTKNPVRTVFTIVAVVVLAGLLLVLAFSAVAAPNTCDAAGYPEANKVEGNPSFMSGDWGTVTADGTEVVFDIEALWQVQVCIKAGPDLVEVVATSLTESLFLDHDVSHMSWRNPTDPTPTPTGTETPSPTPTVTPTATPTQTNEPTPSPTDSPSPSSTPTPTSSPSPTPTASPSETPPSKSPTPSSTPSTPASPTPTSSRTPSTSSSPSPTPTAEPADPIHDDPTYTG